MKKTILLCMIMVMGVWAFGQKDSIAPIVLDEVALKTFRLELPQDKTPFALSRFRFSLADPPRPESSLDAFLVATPGLFIQNSTNYAQDSRIAIRGFGSRAAFGIRGIKLIVDGIPETTPDGQGQVDNLTLGLIRSIEVLRGAQSALYGNASGGVILINTADFETLDRAAASVRWGSYGLQQHRFTTHWGSAAQKWLVHVERFKTTGYREASGMLSHQLQLKARFERPEQGQWNWQLNYTDSPYAQDAGGLTLEEVLSQRRQARSRNIEYQTEEAVKQFKTGLSYQKTRGTQSLHT
ncbi:MAG: TonB-dependent receptor, partial [Flavobacteriaceae bacterium]